MQNLNQSSIFLKSRSRASFIQRSEGSTLNSSSSQYVGEDQIVPANNLNWSAVEDTRALGDEVPSVVAVAPQVIPLFFNSSSCILQMLSEVVN